MDFLSRNPMPVADHFMAYKPHPTRPTDWTLRVIDAAGAVAENAVVADTVTAVAVADDEVADDAVADNTVSEDAVADDAISDDAVVDGVAFADDAISDVAVANDAISDDAFAEDSISDDTVADDAILDDAVADIAVVDGVAVATMPPTKSSGHYGTSRTITEVCEQCFTWYPSKTELWKHVRDVHGDDVRLQCPAAGCGRRFSWLSASASHWTHHAAMDHGQLPFTCELCGRLLSDRCKLDKHVAKQHRDARAALCGICGRYVGDVQSLTEHVAVEHGARTSSKEVITVKTDGGGVGPVRTRRTINCDICGKRFGNYRLMRAHLPVHSGGCGIKSRHQLLPDQQEPAAVAASS